MGIINVTPHTLNIHTDSGVVVVEPSGTVARVATTTEMVGTVDSVPVTTTTFGKVEELPAPRDGVVYVASLLVASRAAATGRVDVLSPGPLVRDDKGNPIGCKGLSRPAG